MRMCGWWCCRRPTWSTASRTAMSMRSVSARRGIRSRSISASGTSCISSRRFWRAPPRKSWRCGSLGARNIRDACRGLCARTIAPRILSRTPDNRGEVRRDPGAAGSHRCRRRSDPPHARRPPEGLAGRRRPASDRYLLIGREGAARPDPVQAAWLYAQMVRWGQAPLSARLAGGRQGGVPARPLRRGSAGDRGARQRRGRRRRLRRPAFDPPMTCAGSLHLDRRPEAICLHNCCAAQNCASCLIAGRRRAAALLF